MKVFMKLKLENKTMGILLVNVTDVDSFMENLKSQNASEKLIQTFKTNHLHGLSGEDISDSLRFIIVTLNSDIKHILIPTDMENVEKITEHKECSTIVYAIPDNAVRQNLEISM